jgi:adenine-specific DNA methylase
MFAVESIPVTARKRVPIAERTFHKATSGDLALYQAAADELKAVERLVPRTLIPRTARTDTRLVDYGYRRYSDLFNARQLLHLSLLAQAVRHLDEPYREMLGLALSNHTTSNCMLTAYSARWRQATPLFAVRAYRHSSRPVELNPWLHGIGRGTFPNAVRQVAAAVAYTKNPVEYTVGGFQPVKPVPGGRPTVINGDSRHLFTIADASVDLVLTDPPYMDNIAYSELSQFFVPWLATAGVLPGRKTAAAKLTLAASGRDQHAEEAFVDGLAACLREARRVLRPAGRLVFTFQHSTPGAWLAVASALRAAGFEALTVFPMCGNSSKGIHHEEGSSTWDAVFVLKPGRSRPGAPQLAGLAHLAALEAHTDRWTAEVALGGPDRQVLRRAVLAAGTVGFLTPIRPGRPLSLAGAL